jgi:FMN-dependent NADH-azoreductase
MAWTDGLLRLWPAWEVYLGDHTIPAAFFPFMAGLPPLSGIAAAYPWIERRLSGDRAHHNLLRRPRDVPVRTSLAHFAVALLSAANDVIANAFDISLNATVGPGRIGLLLVPPLAYFVTYRLCLGLQHSDRAVLEHGIETGIVKRLPHGAFIEVRRPLADRPLGYQGTTVPKKMNKLGSAGSPVPGSFFTPDPAEEVRALEKQSPLWMPPVEPADGTRSGALPVAVRDARGRSASMVTVIARHPRRTHLRSVPHSSAEPAHSLLHLDSSPSSDSVSKHLTSLYADTWRERHGAAGYRYRDVAADPVPPVGPAYCALRGRLEGQGPVPVRGVAALAANAAEEREWALTRPLVAELLAADTVLLGVPVHNLSIPASLKAWIDRVTVPGVFTDPATEESLLRDTEVVVVTARGGRRGDDFLEPFLRAYFGGLGVADVRFVHTELTRAPDVPRPSRFQALGTESLAAARAAVVELAGGQDFASSVDSLDVSRIEP